MTFKILAAAGEASTVEKASSSTNVNNTKSTTGIEDLFRDSPSVTPPMASGKHQKDVKNDIMSLFEKVYGWFSTIFY